MKLTCTLENFKKAIYSTERVIGKQITLPVLENILLETEKGMLRVAATNLEIGVSVKVGAKIEKEGKITVSAKLLGSFINNLPNNGNISLEVVDQKVRMECGGYKAVAKGLSAQEFPIIPETKGAAFFSFNGKELKELIPKLLVSASIDSTRPELLGINLIFEKNGAFLASTDSFRLAEGWVEIKVEESESYTTFIGKNPSMIIPANTLAEILRVIGQEDEDVKVTIEENQVFFQIGNVRIVSRLINGKYPEYKQIIPQKFETKAFVNQEELARAVRISSFFTENKAGEVTFVLKPKENLIEVRAVSQEKGENNTTFELAGDGPDQEIVFNPRYILEGIGAINSSEVAILANNESSPVALRSVEQSGKEMKINERFTYIIMPIKK